MQISGVVENLIYKNNDNGYTVIEVDCGGSLVTCVGILPLVSEGEAVLLEGEFKHTKYGEQFVVSEFESKLPESETSIIKYLSSGIIKGIGEVTAMNIVKKFGVDTFDIIEKNPKRLAEVKLISNKKAMEIHNNILELQQMRRYIIFLQSLDISTNTAIKIYSHYGKNCESIITNNPYRLIEDIEGIGFLTADKIALKLSIGRDNKFRIRAAIIYILRNELAEEGSTFTTLDDLQERVFNLCELPYASFDSLIKELVYENEIILFDYESEKCVGLYYILSKEKSIAIKLKRIKKAFLCGNRDLDADIAEYERINSILLDNEQKNAVKKSINEGVTVITGGPGTGKTTIIKCILHILSRERVLLAAPTGRAAKRISEVCKVEAKTIHRLLDLSFKDGKGYFSFNEETNLDCDTIIVDEVSMIDIFLMQNLLSAINEGTRLILVGDKDQLPSIDVGNILCDIISSNQISVICLETVYRQSKSSQISLNAHRINRGEFPIVSKDNVDFYIMERANSSEIFSCIVELVSERLPKFLGIEQRFIQVLCPMKKTVCGVNNLNSKLQEVINPKSKYKAEYIYNENVFREGDRVMQMVNNYQMEWHKPYGNEFSQGLFNGDMGIIQKISKQGEISILFDDEKLAVYQPKDLSEISLCYAISIHKSQGSEFPVCIIPISSGHPSLFCRNLLYTAITRAKSFVILVGKYENIQKMIDNNYVKQRKTMLKVYLAN